jgi:hypothetical protein
VEEPRAQAPGHGVPGTSAGPALTVPAPSPRVRLARLALDSALAVEGVVAGHAGPHGVGTVEDAGRHLRGVTAAALPGGRYEVGLHLVAAPVPLRPLAERVRERVHRAAARLALEDRLGPVNVAFEDLLDPAEAGPPPPS